MPNKILPEKQETLRERIIKVISDGQPFTIESLRRRLRPRPKYHTLYYHIALLASDLWIERINPGSKPEVFRYQDCVPVFEASLPEHRPSIAADTYRNLMWASLKLRKGHKLPDKHLQELRSRILAVIEDYKEEIDLLTTLYNCQDLWDEKSLVRRIGFKDGNAVSAD